MVKRAEAPESASSVARTLLIPADYSAGIRSSAFRFYAFLAEFFHLAAFASSTAAVIADRA